ncbi:MAG: acyl--CoA ligase [Pseudomonadales bacterium]|nr:acyl--CoA ligase [Pseudomonadales bacterium]MCP5183587.1 acyl--CoA ligase [Pseudomonadales bacterium]
MGEPGVDAIIGPGGRYEVVQTRVRGVTMPVFKNAPHHLRELYQAALEHANRTFYVYEDERYTFIEAWRQAERVMSGLHALGVRPGDRVGIAMRNYPEWVFAFMGITSMGAVAVAMNAWWSGEEMLYAIDDSGLATLFVDRERLQHISPYLGERKLNVIAVRTQHAAGNGVVLWEKFVNSGDGTMHAPRIDPDDHAMILYTSGSTARPKGAVSSHRAIIHSLMGWEAAAAIARAEAGRRQRPDERQPSMIITVPLFHVTGLNGQLLPSFRNGRKVVGMYKWDAEKALALIEREKVTHFSGVPTMAFELVNSPDYGKYDLSSLRSIGGGGAAMTPKHSSRIRERTEGKARASAAYAMTETNGLGASNAGNDLFTHPTSCGRALRPLVEIRIASPDDTTLPPGETGEICIRGPMTFTCYWNRPEDTANTIRDGWVHTGDIGHMDADGFIYITDREKDMIIRGGENIGCQEVEAAIYEMPKVMECAVFGVPDERLGETVAAWVRPQPNVILTAGDVQSHVAECLARFKVPAHVWITDEELPRTASGKIYKRGIREHAIARLNGAS